MSKEWLLILYIFNAYRNKMLYLYINIHVYIYEFKLWSQTIEKSEPNDLNVLLPTTHKKTKNIFFAHQPQDLSPKKPTTPPSGWICDGKIGADGKSESKIIVPNSGLYSGDLPCPRDPITFWEWYWNQNTLHFGCYCTPLSEDDWNPRDFYHIQFRLNWLFLRNFKAGGWN